MGDVGTAEPVGVLWDAVQAPALPVVVARKSDGCPFTGSQEKGAL
jgi:hypothetical protein